MIELRIRNANVVFPWGVEPLAAVDIAEGKIVGLSTREQGRATRVIDADGLHLMPGFIDTHVHLNFLSEADTSATAINEIYSETRGAVLSGVTTALVYYRRLAAYGDDLQAFIEEGQRSSFVDFAIHLGILIEEHLSRLPELARHYGVMSFKMYTCYKDDELRRFGVAGEDDGFIFAVMQRVAGLPGAQVHIHCENEELIRRATTQVAATESKYANAVEAWSAARPPLAEADAIRRMSYLARRAGCRLFVPHVSGALALEAVREGRQQLGREELLAETCPHYLLLSAEGPPPGTHGKVNPPIRRSADCGIMAAALARGEVDVVGTDHATTTREGKDGRSVIDARPGFPGMATLFPALMTLVERQALTLERVAALSSSAARIFDLPGKGLISPGYDADLNLLDPRESRIVRARDLGSASDFSVFEGRELFGWPRMTIVRGRIVAEDGELVDDEPHGRYLRMRPAGRRDRDSRTPARRGHAVRKAAI